MKSGAVRRGFTIIELVIAIGIAGAMAPLLSEIVSLLSGIDYRGYAEVEDQFAIEQLRMYLAGARLLESPDPQELNIQNGKKKYVLREVNNKLLLQKGSLTFLNGISGVEFSQEGDFEILRYRRKDRQYETWIAFAP